MRHRRVRQRRSPGRRRSRCGKERVYPGVIAASRVLFAILGLRIDVRGADHLPEVGPVVVAANHTSFADFLIVGLPAVQRGRLIRFMAKRAVFRIPVGSGMLRAMGHLPVDRPHGTVAARQALRALAQGEVVGVYPEATISRSFVMKDRADLRRGAAYLALAAGAPIVPVAHWGIHRVWTVDGRWSLRRGRAVSITVGEPLLARPGEDAEALTDRLHARLGALVEELLDAYPQPPSDPATAWWWPASRAGAARSPAIARVRDASAMLP